MRPATTPDAMICQCVLLLRKLLNTKEALALTLLVHTILYLETKSFNKDEISARVLFSSFLRLWKHQTDRDAQ